jgi:FkbM family methyltransferase
MFKAKKAVLRFFILVGFWFFFSKIIKIEFHLEETTVDSWDLNATLQPADVYADIRCIKSKVILNKSTNLCVHHNADLVSREFVRYGIFEKHMVTRFLNYSINNPDWLVFDIGAQLGLYSLFCASAGARVLAVEPFYDNQVRLQKAAVLSGTYSLIRLVKNALSNKRNEIKRLNKRINNVGAQALLPNQTYSLEFKNSLQSDESKYYVRTILFDDLIDHVPFNKQNKRFKKAIMKIDIEASEPYAFEHAAKLFDRIEICVIFMEWINLKNKDYLEKERDKMLDFLYSRQYTPHNEYETLLLRENYKKWSFDVIWKKKDC